MTAIAFGLILITFVFLLLAIYLSSIATQVLFGFIALAQAVVIVLVYLNRDEEIKTAIFDAIKGNKPKEDQSESNPYWSRTKWMQNGAAGGSVSSRHPEEQQPARFLDETEKSTPLTPQTFDPNSIPMTALEKKRLKPKVNKGAVREAKLLSNPAAGDDQVTTGFSMQVALEANGNGYLSNGNGMVNHGMEYDPESDDEDDSGFVMAELVDEDEV